MISVRLALSGFAESWSHCSTVADYLARYAASDRFDPEGLTTRISSFLNEVLELGYRSHSAGALAIDVAREDAAIHVRCELPADDAVAEVFAAALCGLDDPDLRDRHRDGFLALLDAPRPAGAFVEMAAIHGLTPTLQRGDGAVVVSLTIPAE
ncbi:MAG: hypothetical protein R3A79_15960 [Nannocystaceae bacterium]